MILNRDAQENESRRMTASATDELLPFYSGYCTHSNRYNFFLSWLGGPWPGFALKKLRQ
jgi:hypothetical protein